MNRGLDCRVPRALWLLVVSAVALLLTACAGSSGPPAPLVGTVWNVQEADGVVFKPLKGGRDAHLRLDEAKRRATGYTGLNSFSGAFQAHAGQLRFGALAATRRAGPPAAMAFEKAYFKALSATRNYRVAGDRLELLDGDGAVRAKLEALPPL
jgi:heat shock protein HslJ